MVLAHGHVDGRGVATRDKEVTPGFLAGVVVEHFLCTAAEDYHVFAGLRVPMDGDDRTGLDSVQHPLGFIIRGIPEVEVLTQAGRGFCLLGQLV